MISLPVSLRPPAQKLADSALLFGFNLNYLNYFDSGGILRGEQTLVINT